MAKNRLFEALALTAAAAIMIVILFVPPAVGLADDGDFPKVTRAFDFDAVAPQNDDRWFRYIFLDYKFDPEWHWWGGFPTSEMLLVAAALPVNRLIARPGMFDLRAMGIVHAAVFLAVLALALPLLGRAPPLRRTILTAGAIFIFCDVGYVCYYNSFYMDTAAFLFLLLAIVFFLRVHSVDVAARFDRIGFLVACILFLTAKSQHSLAGLIIALLFVLERQYKSAVAVAALGILWIVQLPPDYADTARFNVIFFQILPNSAHRARDLAELGLDDSYLSKVGMIAYDAQSGMDDPKFHATFGERATVPRLAIYYLRHPSQAARLIMIGLKDASAQRARMGNYDRRAGKAPSAQSYTFSLWSSLKQRIFDTRGLLYGFYCAALCVAAPVSAWRRGGKRRMAWTAGTLAIALMTVMALLISCLADGADFLRHLFMFNLCVDVLAMALLGALTTSTQGFKSPVRNRII
jgi:hypothetical protein